MLPEIRPPQAEKLKLRFSAPVNSGALVITWVSTKPLLSASRKSSLESR